MMPADSNPFAPDASWETTPPDHPHELARRHHRHLLRWYIATWIGTGIAGGIFGSMMLLMGGPGVMLFGLIFGFLIAVAAGFFVAALGLVLVLLLRTQFNEYSIRLVLSMLCGGSSGGLCTASSADPLFILPAILVGALVPGLLVFLDSRNPPDPA